MKRFTVAFALLVGAVSAQSKPKTPNQEKVESASAPVERTEAGRYHLVAAKAPGQSTSGTIVAWDELFLYDSVTGRVWRYEPSTYFGGKDDPDRVSVDAYFAEVTVDSLHGSHEADFQRSMKWYQAIFDAKAQAYCKDHPTGAYRSPSLAPTESGVDCDTFLKAHPTQ
jgi:hypothetical protein